MSRKRVATILLSSVLAAAITLTGCGSNEDRLLDKKSPVPITIWHYYNGAQMQKFDELVVKFNETVGAEKGIVVEAYNKGSVSELNTKVLDAVNHKIAAEAVPDIFAAYADTAYEINRRGLVADVGQYLTEEEKVEYFPAYLSEGRFENDHSIKLFPIAKSTEVLMLNYTDWNQFATATGASEHNFSTWEGIAELAKQYYEWTDSLTPEADDGKSFFGRDAMANYILVGSYQLGHELFEVNDGKVNINLDKKVMRRLWDNYYLPYISGYYKSIGRFRSDDVKTGDIIAFVGSTSGVSFFPSEVTREDGSTYSIDSKVYPAPNFEGTPPMSVQQGAGMVVVKSTEKKEYAAATFLKWFTNKQQNVDFSIGSGYLPVKKEANNLNVIMEAIHHLQEPISNTLQEVLITGVDMTKSYTLYTGKAFKNGTAARNILDEALHSKAEIDFAAAEVLIESGIPRNDAIARLYTDQSFDQWYDELRAKLKAIIR